MNIGKWVIFSFVMFALFIGTLVTVCMKQQISLVSNDYYKDELKYQDQIKRIQNTNLLEEKPSIKITQDSLKIYFNEFAQLEKGEMKLFCPSNEHNDKSFSISATQNKMQGFSITGLPHGMYKAQLSWLANDKEYFIEEIINL